MAMKRSVISFREVARRLGGFCKPKRLVDPDKLLSLLKSGELTRIMQRRLADVA
jgi:hypothetical protein